MKEAFQIIEDHIVSGRGAEARRILKKISEGKVERKNRLVMAQLSRRANLHALALQLLNSIVRPKGKGISDASDSEKAEYAAALSYLGASQEALGLLKNVNVAEVPQALLYEAYACFSQWNYGQAIPYLSSYIASKKITEYQKLIGKVNLAAALVYERDYTTANNLLDELLLTMQTGMFQLLHGNTLELAAQNAINQGDWKVALKHLGESEKLLGKTASDDQFFVTKWKAVVGFLKEPGDKKNLSNLHGIRSLAVTMKHWETVRDCDRFEAIYRKNTSLLNHVYFGSPYESFRSRILADCKSAIILPEVYSWCFNGGKPKGLHLDLLTGTESRKGKSLTVGQALHRLLVCLSSDFYRPTRLAVIHAQIFPGEYFNPITAPPRVYEIVRRLREWLSENRLPLEIKETSGFYALASTAPFVIQVQRVSFLGNRTETMADKLKAKWPSQSFCARDAAEVLGISGRSILRVLEDIRTKGMVEREGKGPATRYAFKR